MHEVVVLPSTIAAAEAAEANGRPAWRVSSTLFAHIASSQVPCMQSPACARVHCMRSLASS